MTQDSAVNSGKKAGSSSDLTAAEALAALDWYQSVGVDVLVADTPIAWTEHRPPKTVTQNQPPAARPQAGAQAGAAAGTGPLGTAEAVIEAQKLAATADSLEALKAVLAKFDGLSIAKTARNLVFADGNPDAPLMIIGEAPGREEDESGLPFVGVSGKLLDKILAAIGRDRTSTYISNIVNWRPPGNRKPSQGEIDVCLPFIARHIALAKPEVIVLLGDVAGKALLPVTQGITRYRGQWHDYQPAPESDSIPAMASFHPSFLLRTPAKKRESWQDFLSVKARLSSATNG